MKTLIRLLTLPAFAAVAATLGAATVNLTSVEAEKLSDIRLSHASEERSLETVLDELGKNLNRTAKRYLAEGETLDIHFTDIDLAGEFEPWRPMPQSDVRIVKEIYVPRMTFDYKLTGADGSVIAEGSESLVDTSFQMRAATSLDRSVTRYEKQMLDDWLRQFRKKDKA